MPTSEFPRLAALGVDPADLSAADRRSLATELAALDGLVADLRERETALRRERDALVAEVQRLRGGPRPADSPAPVRTDGGQRSVGPDALLATFGKVVESANRGLRDSNYLIDDFSVDLKANVRQGESGLEFHLPDADEEVEADELSDVRFQVNKRADADEMDFENVPDLVGKDRDVAARMIREKGFRVGTVEFEERGEAETVLEQFPGGLTVAEPGTEIDVVVSRERGSTGGGSGGEGAAADRDSGGGDAGSEGAGGRQQSPGETTGGRGETGAGGRADDQQQPGGRRQSAGGGQPAGRRQAGGRQAEGAGQAGGQQPDGRQQPTGGQQQTTGRPAGGRRATGRQAGQGRPGGRQGASGGDRSQGSMPGQFQSKQPEPRTAGGGGSAPAGRAGQRAAPEHGGEHMTDDQRNRSEARRQPDDQPGGGDGTGQQDRQPQRDRQPDRQQRDRLSTGFDPLSGGGQGQQGRPASDPSEVRSQFETLQDSQPGATAPEEMAAEGVGSVSDAVEAGAESGATERGGEEPGRLARWKSKLASLLPGGGDGGEEADGATGDAPSADGSDSGGSTAGGTSADGTTAGPVESGGFGVGGDAGPPTRQSTGPGQGAGSGRGSTPYGGTAPDEFGQQSGGEGGGSSRRGQDDGGSGNRLERGGGG